MDSPYSGLSSQEAARQLELTGPNELVQERGVSALKIFFNQFKSPIILVLIAAAAISLGLSFLPNQETHYIDASLILLIVLLSGIMGFVQDYKAEKTIESLKEMARPFARVMRDGQVQDIPSAEVVPGDLLLLDSGDMVTADAELLEEMSLEVDESALTGESQAVRKKEGEDLFMHTYVTSGHGKARVKETGMRTEIGKLAATLQTMEEDKTSFQEELGSFGKKLSLLVLGIGVLVAAIGFFKYSWQEALLTAISLAVAAIPEGLPAVVVLALAVGARSMFRKNALIRRLSIVESIGAVDIICTDKTGTLTANEMTVVKLAYGGKVLEAGGWETPDPTTTMLLKCGSLCSNVNISQDDEGNEVYLGEQTEVALVKAARSWLKEGELEGYRELDERPFNSERKMMSVRVQRRQEPEEIYAKGAPEVILERCTHRFEKGNPVALTPEDRTRILERNHEFASQALRVLGFAYKPEDGKDMEAGLTWLGLQALIDPPRPEVPEALDNCKTAGIRVVMITGDNPDTAKAISDEIGLESQGVLRGADLETMDDPELEKALEEGVNIFARTSPFDKMRIMDLLQGESRVAMTGDGVNDALALKKADVGVAMGKRGTEVAKEASDIILLDDNFSTIRDAVREGRTIFDNIRKFVNYLLTCNVAEVLVIFLATLLLDLPEPILFPVQILWINLLTDGLVALALGIDPPAYDIMKQSPRPKGEPLINRSLAWQIGAVGVLMTGLLLGTFYLVLPQGLELARSALFTGFVLYEFVRIASIRQREALGWFDNPWLILALIFSLLLQVAILYTPVGTFFRVVPLHLEIWGILAGGALGAFLLTWIATRVIDRIVSSRE